jgi:ATP-dependent DNA helicase MPH1
MTPQTLMNDLKTENCDPRDIVLLVIGELRFASGVIIPWLIYKRDR